MDIQDIGQGFAVLALIEALGNRFRSMRRQLPRYRLRLVIVAAADSGKVEWFMSASPILLAHRSRQAAAQLATAALYVQPSPLTQGAGDALTFEVLLEGEDSGTSGRTEALIAGQV